MVELKAGSSPPRVLVLPSESAASVKAAEIIADAIAINPSIVLGLATGGTPVACYRELIRRHREEDLDFSAVTTFNLDEYVGLAGDHPQSFRHFMKEHLFDHINVDPESTHVPNGIADDLTSHAAAYEEAIRHAGGIELQLLGIGKNGHIAFNEPGAPFESRTRVVRLAGSTIKSNARFFDSADEVPREAITMGIGTILEAGQILLLATGAGKAAAVRDAVEGPVHTNHPASLLRTHSNVTFVLDEAAAAQLSGG
jgi:glucosamine-6-phosphate deaminase